MDKEPEEYIQESKSQFGKCKIEEVNRWMLKLIESEMEIKSEYITLFHNTLSRYTENKKKHQKQQNNTSDKHCPPTSWNW